MYRCVIDTGVLIAARLSSKGAPAELIRRWLGGELDVVVSPRLLAELSEVLAREKFRRWLTEAEATAYVQYLRTHATVVQDPPAESGHSPDPDDDYVVTLAQATGVHTLVSGDPDLTGLSGLRPPVLTPRTLVDLLDRLAQ